jgi:hypothetical protein
MKEEGGRMKEAKAAESRIPNPEESIDETGDLF